MTVELSLDQAISYAKDFENFDQICMAVSLNPDWLTKIPEGRRWSILHHIVLSNNIDVLDRILPSQQLNPNFRLLTKTADGQTVLDIARSHEILTETLKHLERLVKLDELLNYAKGREWNKCFDIVKENPDYGNQKPPYRRFYLIHQLAYSNAVEEFKKFEKIENFRFSLTLRVDGKKINAIARQNRAIQFAEYIEGKYPTFFDSDDDDDKLFLPSENLKRHTDEINVLIVPPAAFHEPDSATNPKAPQLSRKKIDELVPSLARKPSSNTITNLTTKYPIDNVRRLLTCSLTNAIMKDPVVAADGFTYERTAIENYLQKYDHSPNTNQKLAHKNLTSNEIVKTILQILPK